MIKKKQWFKEFKKRLIKEAIPPYDRNIMITWVLISKSYEGLTPREASDECIDYMYGDPDTIDVV